MQDRIWLAGSWSHNLGLQQPLCVCVWGGCQGLRTGASFDLVHGFFVVTFSTQESAPLTHLCGQGEAQHAAVPG